MKQGKPVITLVMVVFALALCVYFGFYVFDTFHDPFTTTTAYDYTHYESVQANGVIIRSEQVLPAQNGIVELKCGEGEKLGVGQTVAYVYQDSQAQNDRALLEELESQILLLEEVAAAGAGLESAARLDEDILQSVVELRASVAQQEFSDAEDQVRDVKRSVLQRSYTYGENITTADLKAQMSALRQEYKLQSSQSAGKYSRVTAKAPGIFSGLVDGLEGELTPQTARTLTPSVLEGYLNAGTSHVEAVGKLITENRWYFAANLPTEIAEHLELGDQAELRFTGTFHQNVTMRVEAISAPEEGQTTVVFSTDRYLGQTTLLRAQSAELIFDEYSGLRLPKQAVHMEKYTTEETEEKPAEEIRTLGVYVLMAGRAEFKPVEIVTETENFYVLRATDDTRSDALRAGDEVIVRATGLYDGKLVDF